MAWVNARVGAPAFRKSFAGWGARDQKDSCAKTAARSRRDDAPQQLNAITAYQVSLRPSTVKAADPS